MTEHASPAPVANDPARTTTPRQLFSRLICTKLHRIYGSTPEQLRFVRNFMLQPDVDHFRAATAFVYRRQEVYLLTDLAAAFVMETGDEFDHLMELGYFSAKNSPPLVAIRVNDLVHRVLSCLRVEEKPVQHSRFAAWVATNSPEPLAVNSAERRVIETLRSADTDRVTVRRRNGNLAIVETERNLGNLDDAARIRELQTSEAFQDITMRRRNDATVSVTQTVSHKFDRADNERRFLPRTESPTQGT